MAAAAAEGEICDVANDNGGGQVVLSGHAGAIDRAVALAPGRGIKRALKLTVSAPFHCALMAPAADAMAEALATADPPAPRVGDRDHPPRVGVQDHTHSGAPARTLPETSSNRLRLVILIAKQFAMH